MANTYHQIYLQTVFAVKYRNAVLNKSWRNQLLGVIGNLINEAGCKTIIVNGVEDRVHCFFGLKPVVSVSELMKAVKVKSSKYINDHSLTSAHFEWKVGYGVFSYNQSAVDTVYKYIQNQEEHHKAQNFRDEYLGLLEEFKIEFDEILNDIEQNLEKINHHGKRAGDIVKGMLQHSRVGSGKKEPTDINALCDEYLRLAYHGLRAKDKSFNSKFETDFDKSLEKINVIPQDIGRVVLNLITNAFYAVNERQKVCRAELVEAGYEPTVLVSTKKERDKVLISVKDNGNGIPERIKEKIFQPFFTTKPTGQGTGLGLSLSLSYDIVKAHGGELQLATIVGGSEFLIFLPFNS